MLKRSFLLLAFLSSLASAALLRVELSQRSDVLDGKPFGEVGPYERLIGKAYFAVDPANPANQIIADIDKAPRNEKGLVEFSADIYVLKPRDPAWSNGSVLFEVSNRGGKGMLGMFNRATGSLDPRDPEHFGDGFLMQRGYTLVWVGWQFDPPARDGLMRLYAPVAKDGDRPITGVVRSEVVVDKKETSHSLGDRDHLAYTPVNPDDPKLTLTVRDRIDGSRRTIPPGDWKIEDRSRLVMPAGFEPGRIYELVYTAQDPVLVGLGPAAVRDLIAFLKYGGNGITVLGDQANFMKRAYAFGVSQSGRFLRTFLYYGFNRDEKDRQVFDGVLSHVAGAGRGSFNIRFGQASRDGHPFLNMLYPTDVFPFTDLDETDPESGLTDGLLRRPMKDHTVPKIFYTNSSYEYYGRAASLIHISPDGQKDAPIPDTTRIYMFAGGQHGPGPFPPVRSNTQNFGNPNNYLWSMRALLGSLDGWVAQGKQPPPSQYPRIAQDTLVPLGAVQFPKIPGVAFPTRMLQAYHVDYGPQYRDKGIVTIDPPKVGKPFRMLVPQVDRDGNETSGVRMPEIQVPLATYTGWNLRKPELGAPDELYSMAGSFIPFPKTKAERAANGDPRLSIEERYTSKQEYLDKIEAAARGMVASGFMLAGDVPKVVERSAAEWDYVH
jgi:hypothetical protein